MCPNELQPNDPSGPVGIVAIGRNEGERLERCLKSVLDQNPGPVVYVDSGSEDGSVDLAQELGVHVICLDMSVPFTMARGRNAGFRKLIELDRSLRWVQFVDGDCEVDPEWIGQGRELLQERPEAVAVCGFRRERFPAASVYNRLIDLEWQGAVGEIAACGGDAMYRVAALDAAGGFDDGMIAGEEPELCVRLRQAGGQVWRLDLPMTVHDAAITSFRQWWIRAKRSGHAYAEGFAKHGFGRQRHNRRELMSALVYGLALPAAWGSGLVIGGVLDRFAAVAIPVSVIAALICLKPIAGAYRARRRLGSSVSEAALYAVFCLLGKVPEAQGALVYFVNRLRGKYAGLMEYKAPA